MHVQVVCVCSSEHANSSHSLALLRVRGERPRCRAAKKRDELAPLHSITSSAMESKPDGTSMPARAPQAAKRPSCSQDRR
jgi:hypothetical protein